MNVVYEKVRVDTHFEKHKVNLKNVTDESPNPKVLHAHKNKLIRLRVVKLISWDPLAHTHFKSLKQVIIDQNHTHFPHKQPRAPRDVLHEV